MADISRKGGKEAASLETRSVGSFALSHHLPRSHRTHHREHGCHQLERVTPGNTLLASFRVILGVALDTSLLPGTKAAQLATSTPGYIGTCGQRSRQLCITGHRRETTRGGSKLPECNAKQHHTHRHGPRAPHSLQSLLDWSRPLETASIYQSPLRGQLLEYIRVTRL